MLPALRLLFATSNPHKIDEVSAILAAEGIEVFGLDALPGSIPEPDETGRTFAENARLKAVAYARATNRLCLAEDSGLEVDALNGAPGVHSARYAGADGTRAERDRANNQKLLRQVRDVPRRRRAARYACAMCLARPDGQVVAETRGTLEGVITDTPAGSNGFGYDPLLYLPDRRRTCAELEPQEKNARSHRGQAARAMARLLAELSLVEDREGPALPDSGPEERPPKRMPDAS